MRQWLTQLRSFTVAKPVPCRNFFRSVGNRGRGTNLTSGSHSMSGSGRLRRNVKCGQRGPRCQKFYSMTLEIHLFRITLVMQYKHVLPKGVPVSSCRIKWCST